MDWFSITLGDSQLIKIDEFHRQDDEDSFTHNNICRDFARVPHEYFDCFALKHSALWTRKLSKLMAVNSEDDVEWIISGGQFFGPITKSQVPWQEHVQTWISEMIVRELNDQDVSLETPHKRLFEDRFHSAFEDKGGFVAINMNREDVGKMKVEFENGKIHECLLLTMDDFLPWI
jgi:hypothetical protein